VTTDATPADEAQTTGVMHIGEVAARTELSLRSLRHWDEVGLVKPSGRTDGGFRLYTEADVEKILLIRRMKPLGFTLEAMSAAMRDIETLQHPSALDAAKTAAHQRLTGILDDAAERREKLVRQLAMADEFVELLGQELG
jgi:MerR family transcriptional regulator, copper efflux regulator